MAKINQREYEVLKNYYFQGYRWIAIRRGGLLVVSKVKPDKLNGVWLPQCPDEDWFTSINATDLFRFIKWFDHEPYNIGDLVAEYEAEAFKEATSVTMEEACENVQRVLTAHIEESEETEVKKDIEWLKEEVDKLETKIGKMLDGKTTYITKVSLEGSLTMMEELRDLINQLDEPEVLSKQVLGNAEELEDALEQLLDEEYHTPFSDVYQDVMNKIDKHLLVPKQDESTDKPETVASVLFDYRKATERVKEVLNMEVEELEE